MRRVITGLAAAIILVAATATAAPSAHADSDAVICSQYRSAYAKGFATANRVARYWLTTKVNMGSLGWVYYTREEALKKGAQEGARQLARATMRLWPRASDRELRQVLKGIAYGRNMEANMTAAAVMCDVPRS